MSKIGWPVRKAKAIFLTGKQGDFGDARKRSLNDSPAIGVGLRNQQKIRERE